MLYEEMRLATKTRHFFFSYHSAQGSLQLQINFHGNVFGNKWCRCNEGSLYLKYSITLHLSSFLYTLVCLKTAGRVANIVGLGTSEWNWRHEMFNALVQ